MASPSGSLDDLVICRDHLTAQLIYGLWFRDPVWLSMVTGRKRVEAVRTRDHFRRAVLTAAAAVMVVSILAVAG